METPTPVTNDTPAPYVIVPPEQNGQSTVPGFATKDAWELAQRQAMALMKSDMVPQQYRSNIGNCIIALDMAYRMGASPLMVMQNLYIVHGNPGWSSKFLIASFNQCGRFTSIRYEWNEARTSCRAWAIEKRTNERIDGPTIDMAMAQKEGWSTKNGSKWQSMPELMLMYRAAAFLIRTYAPEISMGLMTVEEVVDIVPAEVKTKAQPVRMSDLQFAQAKLELERSDATLDDVLKHYPQGIVEEQLNELRGLSKPVKLDTAPVSAEA